MIPDREELRQRRLNASQLKPQNLENVEQVQENYSQNKPNIQNKEEWVELETKNNHELVKEEESNENKKQTCSSTVPSELECTLCLKLFFEPISLVCGHTFCRLCLKEALIHKLQCPLCRSPCHFSVSDAPPNFALTGIIQQQFYDLWAERKQEIENNDNELLSNREISGVPNQRTEIISVMILNVLLFPNQPINLHIFEPRYCLMVHRCIASGNRRFGLVPELFATNEIDVGTLVEISEFRQLPNNTYFISCRGYRRLKKAGPLEVEEDTHGLYRAQIELFDDENVVENEQQNLNNLSEELHHICSRLVDRLSQEQKVNIRERHGMMPHHTQHKNLSFWASTVFDMIDQQRVNLFRCQRIIDRLQELVIIGRDLNEKLNQNPNMPLGVGLVVIKPPQLHFNSIGSSIGLFIILFLLLYFTSNGFEINFFGIHFQF